MLTSISDLPKELIAHILSLTDVSDLQIKTVNKRFNAEFDSLVHWKALLEIYFPYLPTKDMTALTLKQLFRKEYQRVIIAAQNPIATSQAKHYVLAALRADFDKIELLENDAIKSRLYSIAVSNNHMAPYAKLNLTEKMIAFIDAVSNGYKEAVEAILSQNEVDVFTHMTAYEVAASNGHTHILDVLKIQHMVSINVRNALFKSIANGHFSSMQKIMQTNVIPQHTLDQALLYSLRPTLSNRDLEHQLMDLVWGGLRVVHQKIIEAAPTCKSECATFLIDNYTFSDYIVKEAILRCQGNPEITKHILSKQRVSARLIDAYLPVVAMMADSNILEHICDHYFSLLTPINTKSALIRASWHGNVAFIDLLLKRSGVLLTKEDKKSALFIAKAKKQTAVIQYFLDNYGLTLTIYEKCCAAVNNILLDPFNFLSNISTSIPFAATCQSTTSLTPMYSLSVKKPIIEEKSVENKEKELNRIVVAP